MDGSKNNSIECLPKANSASCSPGLLKNDPDDFKVTEQLLFEPADEGEHLLLQVTKVGETTRSIQGKIAAACNVRRSEIGYLGMKDKQSVATQWFSVNQQHVRRPADLAQLKALQIRKHNKKLRRSMGCRNHFEIVVRNIEPQMFDVDCLKVVPNYFGNQRFGRDGQNIANAMKWVTEKKRISKFLKGIYLSSLRSLVFNEVLAERIRIGNWTQVLGGDPTESAVPTGPMWGRGRLKSTDETRTLEEQVVSKFESITHELEMVGLQQERRDLVLEPVDLTASVSQNIAHLSFSLPGGCYATSVLRESFAI